MISVDTGAWIALTDKSDQHYFNAIQIYETLKQQNERFLTTDYIIDETITRLRYDASHQVAVQLLGLITIAEKASVLRITHIDKTLFKDATSIFKKYDTVLLSFTDCVSFAVCKKFEVNQAFAFDQHFTIMGITLHSS